MGEKPLVSDAMKKAIGVPSKPATYEVEKGHIKRFAEAIGDGNHIWHDEISARETPLGGVVAPPTFLRMCIPTDLDKLDLPFDRGLDGGSEWTYFVPVRPGDLITVTQKITGFSEKNGRLGQMLIENREMFYENQLGELVATQKVVSISY